MKRGKISESTLKRSVLRPLSSGKEGILLAPTMAQDAAAVGIGEMETAFYASDLASVQWPKNRDALTFAMIRACNNIRVSGGIPSGVLITLLLPANMEEPKLKEIMIVLKTAAEDLSIRILGGHTQVSEEDSDSHVICSVTVVGASKKPVRNARLMPGMDLVMTRYCAMEAMVGLVKQNREKLLRRLSAGYLDQALKAEAFCSIAGDMEVIGECKAEDLPMHDLSRGGVFGALWEFLEQEKLGMEADLRKIPILQETVEICEVLGKNPYILPSAGSILIGCEDGEELCERLMSKGVPAAVIGTVTKGPARVLKNGEEIRYLDRPDYTQEV